MHRPIRSMIHSFDSSLIPCTSAKSGHTVQHQRHLYTIVHDFSSKSGKNSIIIIYMAIGNINYNDNNNGEENYIMKIKITINNYQSSLVIWWPLSLFNHAYKMFQTPFNFWLTKLLNLMHASLINWGSFGVKSKTMQSASLLFLVLF